MTNGMGLGDIQNLAGIRDIATLMRDPNGIADLLTTPFIAKIVRNVLANQIG